MKHLKHDYFSSYTAQHSNWHFQPFHFFPTYLLWSFVFLDTCIIDTFVTNTFFEMWNVKSSTMYYVMDQKTQICFQSRKRLYNHKCPLVSLSQNPHSLSESIFQHHHNLHPSSFNFFFHFATFKLFSLFFFEGFPYLPEIALKNQRKLLKVDLRRQLDKNMKGIFHIFWI